MDGIKNVLLCGLGGVGCVLATKIKDSEKYTLKILVDETRYNQYNSTPTKFNSKSYYFDYILPKEKNFKADLIIIATKDDGLDSAIKNIENFVTDKTIIISVLNGIHSEKKIKEKYNKNNIPITFYIGNSCIRNGRNITQDGNYKFYIGKNPDDNQSESIKKLNNLFFNAKINHEISDNILDEYWKKFMVNVGLNQVCSAYNLTFKEVKNNKILVEEMIELIKEVKNVSKEEGIANPQKIYDETIKFLIEDFEDATPSMLQDLRAGRKTELEIFSGEVIRLGKKHNIPTPSNEIIYKKIKNIEEIKN